jgi:hypothetical protein
MAKLPLSNNFFFRGGTLTVGKTADNKTCLFVGGADESSVLRYLDSSVQSWRTLYFPTGSRLPTSSASGSGPDGHQEFFSIVGGTLYLTGIGFLVESSSADRFGGTHTSFVGASAFALVQGRS